MRIQAQTAQQIINNYGDKKDDDEAAQLEECYLRRVFETTRPLNLGGIDKKARSIERSDCLNAEEIYTPLLTLSVEQLAAIEEKRERFERERPRSAVDLLNAEKCLVLLGDPGSGKSMFVNFVALCMAGERLGKGCANLDRLRQSLPNDEGKPEKTPQPWEHEYLLPVIFTLRDVAAKALPKQPDAPGRMTHLLAFLEQRLAEDELADYAPILKKRLDASGGMILFDGLDEVPEADKRRAQILQAVEDFASRFAKCRILVTCRTYAYQRQEWRLKERYFPTVAVLSPFHEGQMRLFITRWYQHGADVRGANLGDWEGRAAELKHALRVKPQLLSLARSPLLLTLMASLHAWRGGSLPDRRAELYEDATEMLLETWVENKKVRGADGKPVLLSSLEDILNVPKKAIKEALSLVAFNAHKKQSTEEGREDRTEDISEGELMTALVALCREEHVNQFDVADHLSKRVGLLASRGVGVYTFPHRSFQEYLAACHLSASQKYPSNLADLVRESPLRWREVALLAAGKTSDFTVLFVGLVNKLCFKDASQSVPDADVYAALFAAQAVTEAHKLHINELRDQIPRLRQWLIAILTERQPKDAPLSAIERAQAGDLLAAFSDDRKGVGLKDRLPDIDWINIPEGDFWMGSDATVDPDTQKDEQPRHRVHVSEFWMSRYPVTNAQYQAFVEDKGYQKASYWKAGGGWKEKEQYDWTGPRHFDDPRFALANHPVVGVSWYEAMAFCAWLTSKKPNFFEKLGFSGVVRLPTEAEWEYAARGPGDAYRRYPWGGDITPDRANYGDTNIGATSAVGAFPRGRAAWMGGNGLEEMTGNVWEWCLHDQYDYAKGERTMNEIMKNIGKEKAKVVRGGAWYYVPRDGRCAYRLRDDPDDRYVDQGFRVVVSVAWTR